MRAQRGSTNEVLAGAVLSIGRLRGFLANLSRCAILSQSWLFCSSRDKLAVLFSFFDISIYPNVEEI
eukprot:SAG31_NODE_3474_length_4233_cov_5.560716_3_plen_67_part_00